MSDRDYDTTPTYEDRVYAQRLFLRVYGDGRAWLAAELIGARLHELHPRDEVDARIIRRARALYETYSQEGR